MKSGLGLVSSIPSVCSSKCSKAKVHRRAFPLWAGAAMKNPELEIFVHCGICEGGQARFLPRVLAGVLQPHVARGLAAPGSVRCIDMLTIVVYTFCFYVCGEWFSSRRLMTSSEAGFPCVSGSVQEYACEWSGGFVCIRLCCFLSLERQRLRQWRSPVPATALLLD